MQETTNLQKTMSIQACTERVQKIVAVSYPCAKAYVHSFGCQLNVSDGEKIKGLLQSMGFSLTETHEDADVIDLIPVPYGKVQKTGYMECWV